MLFGVTYFNSEIGLHVHGKRGDPMTTAYKVFFEDMPDTISIPVQYQHKKVELILLTNEERNTSETWEPEFFNSTFGSIPDLQRGTQEPLTERESW